MSSTTSLIVALEEEYKSLDASEAQAAKDYQAAAEAYSQIVEQKSLVAKLLNSKGRDPEKLIKPTPEQAAIKSNGHLPAKPLSNTHAVYLLMRKNGNTGFSVAELATLAEKASYNLSETDITRVVWRQYQKKLMTKEAGKFRLSPTGEKFNNFRSQPPKEAV